MDEKISMMHNLLRKKFKILRKNFIEVLRCYGKISAHDIEQTAPGLARQTYMKGAICNKTCEHLDPCYNVPIPPEDPRMQKK